MHAVDEVQYSISKRTKLRISIHRPQTYNTCTACSALENVLTVYISAYTTVLLASRRSTNRKTFGSRQTSRVFNYGRGINSVRRKQNACKEKVGRKTDYKSSVANWRHCSFITDKWISGNLYLVGLLTRDPDAA